MGRAAALTFLVVHFQLIGGAVASVGGNQISHVPGLPAADSIGAGLNRAAEHLHRAEPILLDAGVGLQRDILRLYAGIRLHQTAARLVGIRRRIGAAKHGVDPIQHRLLRAAVFGDGQPFQLPAILDLLDDAQVGTAKAVDGLLVVADDEQLAGLQRQRMPVSAAGADGGVGVSGGGQVESDFGLQRVGVLELVNQEVGVLLLEMGAGGGRITQQVARPDQQVVKSSHTVGLAPGGVVHGETLEVIHQAG